MALRARHMDIDDKRLSQYRGYESQVVLIASSKDMFEAWFEKRAHEAARGCGAWEACQSPRGPYSRRWAYLVGELTGWAAIDVILGRDDWIRRNGRLVSDSPTGADGMLTMSPYQVARAAALPHSAPLAMRGADCCGTDLRAILPTGPWGACSAARR